MKLLEYLVFSAGGLCGAITGGTMAVYMLGMYI